MKSSECVIALLLVTSVASAGENIKFATEPKDVDPTLVQELRLRFGADSADAMLSSSSSDAVMDNLNNVVQGVCRDQSGA